MARGRVSTTQIWWAALVPCVFGSSTIEGEDWPAHMADASRSGVTTESLPLPLEEAWVFTTPFPPQPAWPEAARWDGWHKAYDLKSRMAFDRCHHAVVAGGSVFFGSSSSDTVYSLDAATGSVRWRFFADGPVRFAPAHAAGNVYFGADDGCVYCVKAESGDLVWKRRVVERDQRLPGNERMISAWPVRGGLVLRDGNVFAAAGVFPTKGVVVAAFSGPDGRELWRTTLHDLTVQGYLLASATRLYAPAGRNNPMVFDISSGKRLRVLSGHGGSYALLSGEQIIFGPGRRGELGLVEGEESDQLASFDGNHMIVTAASSFLHTDTELSALDRPRYLDLARRRRTAMSERKRAAEKLEKLSKGREADEGRTLREALALAGAEISRLDGEMAACVRWRRSCANPHALILAGDVLFAGGDGAVAAFAAEQGDLLWSGSVPGKALGLAAGGGALFVASDLGSVHCFRPARGSGAGAPRAPVAAATQPAAPSGASAPAPFGPIVDGLAGQWLLSQECVVGAALRDHAGGRPGRLESAARFDENNAGGALRFDGWSQRVALGGAGLGPELPRRAMSAASWVRVDRVLEWGGIAGAMQDNGDHERGWLLGFRRERFAFGVATRAKGRLTYLEASGRLTPGAWHHVAGTYDGAAQRLYVDGELAAEASEQTGDIEYPESFHFDLGAYHDDDELFRLDGALHEVRLYDRGLSPGEVRVLHDAKRPLLPFPVDLASGPWVEPIAAGVVAVSWETITPGPTILRHGREGAVSSRVEVPGSRTEHHVELAGLEREAEYELTPLVMDPSGGERPTARFRYDTRLNPLLPDPRPGAAPSADADASPAHRDAAARILAASRVRQGYCLVLGAGSGRLARELALGSRLQVVVLEPDLAKRDAVRRTLASSGLLGLRVSVQEGVLDPLPFGTYSASLVVSESVLEGGSLPPSAREVFRVLRPCGGTVVLASPRSAAPDSRGALGAWFAGGGMTQAEELLSDASGEWVLYSRPPLDGAGEWTHQYGGSDNSSCSQDRLASGPMDLLWWGRPGARPMPDRGARNPAPLFANGRLLVQGDRALFGMDAYNGTILWTLASPHFRRSNMPRDTGDIAADADVVYVAAEGKCQRIDAATGSRLASFSVPLGRDEDARTWGYVARSGSALLGSGSLPGASYLGDGGEWFDGPGREDTAKVTSRYIFALDARSGVEKWIYKEGIVVNSTIVAAAGKVFFVESRAPAALASRDGRMTKELATEQHLVALDLETGSKIWDKPCDFSVCQRVLYLLYGGGALVASGSSDRYHHWAFDAATGGQLWKSEQLWQRDHHGGTVQHPVVAGDLLVNVQSAFDLRTGALKRSDIPERRGCGTLSASLGSLFYRHYSHGRFDLATGKAVEWSGIRGGCWLGVIPAGGVVLAPESSSGCYCTDALQISAAFLPSPLTDAEKAAGQAR